MSRASLDKDCFVPHSLDALSPVAKSVARQACPVRFNSALCRLLCSSLSLALPGPFRESDFDSEEVDRSLLDVAAGF